LERPFVEVQIAGNLAATAGLRRDDGSGAPPIIVEDRVAAQSVACDFLDPWRDPDAGVALAGRKNEACEIAERVTLRRSWWSGHAFFGPDVLHRIGKLYRESLIQG